ncbi:hypothetical protein POX_c04638 [Penicillium oxalicum]|nr:hypothetical protein POX_c04638 [Penicillium oxalicum]KAI2791760.1 hypothetical protein POX_c04638 [Penicillium oxalicum]
MGYSMPIKNQSIERDNFMVPTRDQMSHDDARSIA